MKTMAVRAYILGQKPSETNPQRFVAEAHPDAEFINTIFLDDGRIAVGMLAPETGPKVLLPVIVAQGGEPIPLMIGEELGKPNHPITIQAADGKPLSIFVFPLFPRPGLIERPN